MEWVNNKSFCLTFIQQPNSIYQTQKQTSKRKALNVPNKFEYHLNISRNIGTIKSQLRRVTLTNVTKPSALGEESSNGFCCVQPLFIHSWSWETKANDHDLICRAITTRRHPICSCHTRWSWTPVLSSTADQIWRSRQRTCWVLVRGHYNCVWQHCEFRCDQPGV